MQYTALIVCVVTVCILVSFTPMLFISAALHEGLISDGGVVLREYISSTAEVANNTLGFSIRVMNDTGYAVASLLAETSVKVASSQVRDFLLQHTHSLRLLNAVLAATDSPDQPPDVAVGRLLGNLSSYLRLLSYPLGLDYTVPAFLGVGWNFRKLLSITRIPDCPLHMRVEVIADADFLRASGLSPSLPRTARGPHVTTFLLTRYVFFTGAFLPPYAMHHCSTSTFRSSCPSAVTDLFCDVRLCFDPTCGGEVVISAPSPAPPPGNASAEPNAWQYQSNPLILHGHFTGLAGPAVVGQRARVITPSLLPYLFFLTPTRLATPYLNALPAPPCVLQFQSTRGGIPDVGCSMIHAQHTPYLSYGVTDVRLAPNSPSNPVPFAIGTARVRVSLCELLKVVRADTVGEARVVLVDRALASYRDSVMIVPAEQAPSLCPPSGGRPRGVPASNGYDIVWHMMREAICGQWGLRPSPTLLWDQPCELRESVCTQQSDGTHTCPPGIIMRLTMDSYRLKAVQLGIPLATLANWVVSPFVSIYVVKLGVMGNFLSTSNNGATSLMVYAVSAVRTSAVYHDDVYHTCLTYLDELNAMYSADVDESANVAAVRAHPGDDGGRRLARTEAVDHRASAYATAANGSLVSHVETAPPQGGDAPAVRARSSTRAPSGVADAFTVGATAPSNALLSSLPPALMTSLDVRPPACPWLQMRKTLSAVANPEIPQPPEPVRAHRAIATAAVNHERGDIWLGLWGVSVAILLFATSVAGITACIAGRLVRPLIMLTRQVQLMAVKGHCVADGYPDSMVVEYRMLSSIVKVMADALTIYRVFLPSLLACTAAPLDGCPTTDVMLPASSPATISVSALDHTDADFTEVATLGKIKRAPAHTHHIPHPVEAAIATVTVILPTRSAEFRCQLMNVLAALHSAVSRCSGSFIISPITKPMFAIADNTAQLAVVSLRTPGSGLRVACMRAAQVVELFVARVLGASHSPRHRRSRARVSLGIGLAAGTMNVLPLDTVRSGYVLPFGQPLLHSIALSAVALDASVTTLVHPAFRAAYCAVSDAASSSTAPPAPGGGAAAGGPTAPVPSPAPGAAVDQSPFLAFDVVRFVDDPLRCAVAGAPQDPHTALVDVPFLTPFTPVPSPSPPPAAAGTPSQRAAPRPLVAAAVHYAPISGASLEPLAPIPLPPPPPTLHSTPPLVVSLFAPRHLPRRARQHALPDCILADPHFALQSLDVAREGPVDHTMPSLDRVVSRLALRPLPEGLAQVRAVHERLAAMGVVDLLSQRLMDAIGGAMASGAGQAATYCRTISLSGVTVPSVRVGGPTVRVGRL